MSEVRYVRPQTFPPVIKNLLIINVLVWLAQLFYDKKYSLSDKLSLQPILPRELKQALVDNHIINANYGFNPYQIITHMFAHASYDPRGNIIFYHILFNMFALWMFGRVLESVWGAKRFLLFYLSCGIGAALFHLLIQYFRCEMLLHHIEAGAVINPEQLSGAIASAVGASGAIMGVLAGFAYLFPNTELFIMFLPIPIKAKWAVGALILFDLLGGTIGVAGDNIAHFAHLGGALTGLIIVYIWNKTNRKTLY
jgi:membrane associated rhomboid family serine protease